ncbi:hypothetical protein C9J38_21580 [Photobacterium sp. GB-210]|nr:hypothetical protein C9J38_21580 [Photobacterium sp. GB-210]
MLLCFIHDKYSFWKGVFTVVELMGFHSAAQRLRSTRQLNGQKQLAFVRTSQFLANCLFTAYCGVIPTFPNTYQPE